MKLYYDPASTVSRPIMLFLYDHPMDVELVHVDLTTGEHRSDWYGRINPSHQLPTLVDGDFRLTESATILRYLATVVKSPAYPREIRANAKVNEALDWFNTGFYRDHGYGIVYPQIFPTYRVHPAQTSDLLAWHQERTRERLQFLNDAMIGDGTWVAGDFSIADYFGAALATLGDVVGFDLEPWPAVCRWLSAMKARPGWAEANAAFYGWRSAIRASAVAA